MGTKEIIEIAESGLKYQIDNGKSDFVIYPFGAYGKLVKYILNSMGVQERMIVDNKKYVLKEEKNNSKYDYLVSRNFNYFPNNFNLDNYVVYEYLENINLSDEERLLDIVKLIGLLHAKTTRYKVIDIDDYKVIYEDLLKEIDTTTNYYLQLNDLIDNELYMAPSKYLLVRNISKIYSALSFCKFELDNWYELIKGKSKERLVYTHNNLEIDHLIRTNNPYLISWDKAKIDFPINDIYNLDENNTICINFPSIYLFVIFNYSMKKDIYL